MSDQRSNNQLERVPACGTLPVATFAPPSGATAFDMWHEVGRTMWEVRARGDLPFFHAESEFYELDGLVFGRASYSGTTYSRRPQHLRTGETDRISLQFPIRGGIERGLIGDRPFEAATDRITLRDWAHPFTAASEPHEQLSLLIPRQRVVARDFLYERRPVITWMLDTPQGRMLANALLSLWQTLPNADAADAPTLAGGILGLLNGLISPVPVPGQVLVPPEAFLGAMKRFLDTRLADPTLSVDQLVEAFRCSRATVYRCFKECGGVQSYIRTQRLARCFRDLKRLAPSRVRVREVAERWGFTDMSHFYRLFKRQFGVTPSETMNAERSSDAETPSTSLSAEHGRIAALHDWLAQT